jgi:mycothiol synthase
VNVRRPTSDDASAVTELIRTFETTMVGLAEQSEQDLRTEWADLELERDTWLVELDGALAGYAALFTDGPPITDGYVHPDFRGRGVGSRLIELAEAEARSRGLPKLQNGILTVDERAQELLGSRGYREVRRYHRMAIELDDPPAQPDWPFGLTVATVDQTDVDRFHDALDEAFAEEWGHEPGGEVDWRRIRERRHPDHSLWLTVNDGDEIAATALLDEERWGGGWVAAIGVRKPWRRRGIGEALLLHSFRQLYDRGQRRIALGVDTQNPTGATRLYERAGMKVEFSAVFFEKSLT